jgi:isochorismate hydrolase
MSRIDRGVKEKRLEMMLKEAYFTSKNIDTKSAEFLECTKPFAKKIRYDFKVKKSALIIVDMQKYFLDPHSPAYLPSAPAIIPKIQDLITYFHQHKSPIIFSRHLNTPQDAKNMGTWWRDILEKENPYSELTPELEQNDALVIEKTQYDAFYHTNLVDTLRQKGITQVVITGVMTHLCCETTARTAFMHGLEVFFPVDTSATYNETFHLATLTNLAHGFADITNSAALMGDGV